MSVPKSGWSLALPNEPSQCCLFGRQCSCLYIFAGQGCRTLASVLVSARAFVCGVLSLTCWVVDEGLQA